LALAAELVTGITMVEHRPPAAAPVTAEPSAPSSLIVGGRTVRLVGMSQAANTLLNRVAAEIGDAVEAVVRFWGQDWQREILVVATSTDYQFAQEAGQNGQFSDVAAATVADRVDLARRIAWGERIVFAPGAAAMSDRSLRVVMRHELFHYAARTDTAPDAPQWLVEGVADFVGRTDKPTPGPDALPPTLPTDAELATAGPQRSRAYDRAWWFARFVADTYGAPKLRELYLRACGPGYPDPATAVSETLGDDMPDVLARWAQWLAR
jgi:hypothetical protein